MDYLEIIQSAKIISHDRLAAAPDFEIFRSIEAQLTYLRNLLDGKITDKSKLKEINVGLYAIREFEESDPEFAALLKKVQYIADRMSKGLNIE